MNQIFVNELVSDAKLLKIINYFLIIGKIDF